MRLNSNKALGLLCVHLIIASGEPAFGWVRVNPSYGVDLAVGPTLVDCHDRGGDDGDNERPTGPGPSNSGPTIINFEPTSGALITREPFRGSAADLIHKTDCPRFFDESTASKILSLLEKRDDHCRYIPLPYLIDCLAAHYEEVADSLSNSGEQRQVKRAFRAAAAKLRSIVDQTEDQTLERKRFNVTGRAGSVSPRALRPVNPALQRAAAAAAIGVVNELQTVLLRSAERSAKRKILFQEVSRAVGSDKLLLRS